MNNHREQVEHLTINYEVAKLKMEIVMIELLLFSKPAILTEIAATNILVNQQSEILKEPPTDPTCIVIAGLLLVVCYW